MPRKKRRYKTNTGDGSSFTEEKKPEEVERIVHVDLAPEPDHVAVTTPTFNYKVNSQGGLRLRKGPSLDDDVVKILKHLSWVTVDEIKPSGEWGRATTSEGAEGWLMMKYLKKM